MPKPIEGSYMPYFKKYIDLVVEDDLQQAFNHQAVAIETFLYNITEEKSNYAYATDKWTLKEMLQHITDTERIFCYRALAVARGDKQNIPGFDENTYAANSNANNKTWHWLCNEFLAVRKATLQLFEGFTTNALSESGTINNYPANASAIGFTILGHFYHHANVAKERYFV